MLITTQELQFYNLYGLMEEYLWLHIVYISLDTKTK